MNKNHKNCKNLLTGSSDVTISIPEWSTNIPSCFVFDIELMAEWGIIT